jgi:SAM-dependent methyltransferase
VRAIEDCTAGRISPEVAVARLVLAGMSAAGIVAALEGIAGPAVDAMRALVAARMGAVDALAAEVRETAQDHDASAGIARIASFFDRAVQHSPEASVALYSLGDPAILAAATEEIVVWLSAHRLLPQDADVLDLGCGIGRIAAALAGRCRHVLAVDVSAGMVAEAARRLAAVPNVLVRATGGEDLDWLEAGAFDLVVAVDSFPYIVQAGLGQRHVQGAARALRPGGHLCLLNLSYRDDLAADRADTAAWATASGMQVIVNGVRPFRLWDGAAFVLARDEVRVTGAA